MAKEYLYLLYDPDEGVQKYEIFSEIETPLDDPVYCIVNTPTGLLRFLKKDKKKWESESDYYSLTRSGAINKALKNMRRLGFPKEDIQKAEALLKEIDNG